MEEIKCTSYEKREFIRYLEYAREMKLKTKIKQGKFDDTYYDIKRIDLLIKRVEGIVPQQDYQRNSLEYTHENKKDQEEQIYKKEYYDNVVKGRRK